MEAEEVQKTNNGIKRLVLGSYENTLILIIWF